MKFIISLTDDYDEELPEQAKLEKITVRNHRTFHDMAGIRGFMRVVGDWKSIGKNHQVNGLTISREIEIEVTIIEINSLEELLKLQVKCNEPLIISNCDGSFDKYDIPTIEIYNGYRE